MKSVRPVKRLRLFASGNSYAGIALFCMLSIPFFNMNPYHPAQTLAQAATTIVEFVPFRVDGMSAEEGMVIEDLIRDNIKKIKTIMLVFPGVDDIIPREYIDYIFHGKIFTEEESYILQLEVMDTRLNKQTTWTSSYRSSSDMALKAPAINYTSLLGAVSVTEAGEDEDAEEIKPDVLLGRWSGDSGIEQVFFLRGGEARAYLSTGAGMELKYRIEDRRIIIEQKSKNDPRYYSNAPAPVAAALVQSAKPKRWEFSLYGRGQLLKGYLYETTADFDGAEITAFHDGATRKAEWKKSGR